MLKCPECGQSVYHAQFCSECGHHFDAFDEVAAAPPQAAAPAPAPAPAPVQVAAPAPVQAPAPFPAPTAATSNKLALLIVPAVLVFLAIVIGGAWFLMASSDSDVTEYEQSVAEAMGPVLGAHESLSGELEDISGTNTDGAKSAVGDLKDELTRAEGRIEALQKPSSDELVQLREGALNAIRRGERFVDAVEEVLANPSSSRVDDLSDREAELVDALEAAGPTVAGDKDVVFGAEDLADWAPERVKATAKVAADKRAKALAAQQARVRALGAERRREAAALAEARAAGAAAGAAAAGSASAASGGAGSPTGATTNCGGGVWAGANTTCSFAAIVRMDYNSVPGESVTVDTWSPVTQRTYSMYCRPAGNGWILCTGGNNASVWF